MLVSAPDGWKVTEGRYYVAVVPRVDLIEHDEQNSACACGPQVRFGDAEAHYDRQMLIHAAVDGRE